MEDKKHTFIDDILVYDAMFFGDTNEHNYDFECYDGIAYGTLSDDEDETAPKNITMIYPKLAEVMNDDDMQNYILKYNGLYDLTANDILYEDILLAYGVIVKKDAE